MTVKLNNFARTIQPVKGTPYFQWKLFVDEPPEKLKGIRRVIYTLHPTFPNPTRISERAEDQFAVESAGWGEFNVLVTVEFQDGREEIFEYPLDLAKPWPTQAASA